LPPHLTYLIEQVEKHPAAGGVGDRNGTNGRCQWTQLEKNQVEIDATNVLTHTHTDTPDGSELDTIGELMAGENLRFNDAEALARQFDHFPLAISFLLKNQ
jgi:hypothetical protein